MEMFKIILFIPLLFLFSLKKSYKSIRIFFAKKQVAEKIKKFISDKR